MTVGARIKAEREAQGMSRRQLSEASGVPYPTLAGLENGDQQGSTALPALAAALHVGARWLQTGKGPKAAPAESQVAGFDAGKLQDSFRLAQFFQELTTGTREGWDADPRRLVIAYQVVQAEARELTESVLVDLTKRLSAQIKTTEGKSDVDQRREVEGTGGKDGRGRKRGAGKA